MIVSFWNLFIQNYYCPTSELLWEKIVILFFTRTILKFRKISVKFFQNFANKFFEILYMSNLDIGNLPKYCLAPIFSILLIFS